MTRLDLAYNNFQTAQDMKKPSGKERHTVYPFVPQDLIPITPNSLRILNPEEEQLVMSSVREDQTDPLFGSDRFRGRVHLLAVRILRTAAWN
jgi:hypothetical protein